jgi:PST family polysaccharide transporter
LIHTEPIDRPAGPQVDDEGDAHSELRRSIRAGVGWSLVNSCASKLFTVASGIVIARMIAPRGYGVFAVGFLVLTLITSVNELGVSVSILRWPTDPTAMARTACTLSFAMSLVLYASIALAAPFIASTLHTPTATIVIRLIGLNVVLDGISSVPNALLMRSFKQGRRAIVDAVAFVPGTAVSIGLVAAGWGAKGLAVGSLAGNLTAVVLVYILAPARPAPGWSPSDARQLLRSGLPFAATSALYLATLNVDYIVVGHLLGTLALGLYLFAFNLSSWPANLVSLALRRVTIPGFARIVDDERALLRAFTRSLHLVASFAVLSAVMLALLAPELVTVVYGRKWLPAAHALRWLALLGGCRVLLDLGYDVLVAANKGRALVCAQVTWLIALGAGLPIAAHFGGIVGVSIAHVVVAILIVAPAYGLALRGAGLPTKSVSIALGVPLFAGIACTILILSGRALQWPPLTQVLVLGAAGTSLYLALLTLDAQNRMAVIGFARPLRARVAGPGLFRRRARPSGGD